MSDLFPGVVLPEHDYGILQSVIETATSDKGLQIIPQQVMSQYSVTLLITVVSLSRKNEVHVDIDADMHVNTKFSQ